MELSQSYTSSSGLTRGSTVAVERLDARIKSGHDEFGGPCASCDKPHLVPDHGGLILEIAITLPPFLMAPAQELKRRALGRFAEALPRGLVLFLITEGPHAAGVTAWLKSLDLSCELRMVDTVAAGEMHDSNVWTQDPFMTAEQAGLPILLHLASTDHEGRHAHWLAPCIHATCDTPPIHLAGGNTLTGATFRLVGAKSLENTTMIGDRPISLDEAHDRHVAFDPRPMHVFGFALPGQSPTIRLSQQPHHLDLVVSLTGRVTADGRPILLIADPRRTVDPNGPRMPGWAEQLDASVARLEGDGFAVLRNRVPYLAHQDHAPNPMLRAYNNVILENDLRTELGKIRPLVWVPHFGDLEPDLRAYDDENRQIWEDLGFEIVPVYGWSAFARAGGAIRCVSKVLRRGRY